MACTSLTALLRACGAEGLAGGISKAWAMTYADAVEGTNGKIYTTTTGGIVSAIDVATGKLFVEIGLLKSSAGLGEELTKNRATGTAFITQTLTLVLADLTTENRTFVESVLNQPIVVIVRTRTGKLFVAGLSGDLELATLAGGTGTAEGDLIGYTLTFTGVEQSLMPPLDPTLLPTLLVPAT